MIGEGTSDDIFVSTQGDDIVIGGLGEDTYETRILGETGETAIDNGTETLNDLGGVGEVDTVFFEGVRDLGDLVFDRVELRREGDDRSLEIRYEQYRVSMTRTQTRTRLARCTRPVRSSCSTSSACPSQTCTRSRASR